MLLFQYSLKLSFSSTLAGVYLQYGLFCLQSVIIIMIIIIIIIIIVIIIIIISFMQGIYTYIYS